MDLTSDLYDGAELVLSYLEDHKDVVYAEVGTVQRLSTEIIVNKEGIRSSNKFDESGIWCRPFSNGAAEYRYTTDLCSSNLKNTAEKAVRGGKLLAQEIQSQYDPNTIHRAMHNGYTGDSQRLSDIGHETKEELVRDTSNEAFQDLSLDRLRVKYRDDQLDTTVMTSTGCAVTNVLDRVQIGSSLTFKNGRKIRDHTGNTSGDLSFNTIQERFDDLKERSSLIPHLESSYTDSENIQYVVLGPIAAGQLFHILSHYLEIDTIYLGLSSFQCGDQITSDKLVINDNIVPGSFAARAYDAEARPTQPYTLINDGKVENLIHNVASSAEESTNPYGNMIPSIGYDRPPRIHARHLDVEGGTTSQSELKNHADLYIEKFKNNFGHCARNRVRNSVYSPASVLYANNIKKNTSIEDRNFKLSFPISEGYVMRQGEKIAVLSDSSVKITLKDLLNIDELGAERKTVTGTCRKHKSLLPFAVTAPAVGLKTTIAPSHVV